jgi:hypothetical protein
LSEASEGMTRVEGDGEAGARMIIVGIALTPGGRIGDYEVSPAAIDLRARPHFYAEHRRRIGCVVHLGIVGANLIVTAETDDAEALTFGFLSPAGRVLEADRRPDGSRVVRRFALQEVSAVRTPMNPEARILERRERDPLVELQKTSDRQFALFRAGFEAAALGLQTLGRLRA